MSQQRSSIYYEALQVTPARIAALTDEELNELMLELLTCQAYKSKSPLSKISVNTEGKAKDSGCDGWSEKPEQRDEWLSSTDTCWQFKAGTAGTPARLAGEVLKDIPRETLGSGGRFVVIATGSTNGIRGERDRRAKLISDAVSVGIPTENIEVIGSDKLATWCNQNPAVAARWAGRPHGLWTLEDWSKSEEHQVPWQASETVRAALDARRTDLDFENGSVYHLHIQGHPGVGKTRYALELCRGAAWYQAVVYIRQASDVRLLELIDSVAAHDGVRLLVVADEVQAHQLRSLRDSVGRGDGRIRLITIGHCSSPDSNRIPTLLIKPLGEQEMADVIKGLYPAMPLEHVDFVVRFAAGYVRLGRLAADAVVRNPSINVRGLLGHDAIRLFLDGMLGSGDRRSLYVVAVLTNVGWDQDKQREGQAIAEHFGLAWNTVRVDVEEFHRRFGIAPRGGRYRYISPTPLGIHLAVEAWEIFPDLLQSLPDVLPTEESKAAYDERLKAMTSNPQTREFARSQLAFFFRLDDFVEPRSARRWSALSAADPPVAAQNILRALTGTSLVDRQKIKDRARREVVQTLVSLAWTSSSFHDATKALALLAEAENESWGNNATGEFVSKFQIFLAGTAVPYLDRMTVLDDLLAEGRSSLAGLVVKALTQVANWHHSRTCGEPASDEVPEMEWQPSTWDEHFQCFETALSRLCRLADQRIHELERDLVAAAEELSRILGQSELTEIVANLFHSVRTAYPESREPLRRIIASVIVRERKYAQKLSDDELQALDDLHAQFEDKSLLSRLKQYVGQTDWDQEEVFPELSSLAEELLTEPQLLAENWPWLTSGEAGNGWRLGIALSNLDSTGMLAETLPLLSGCGADHRVLCGYVCTRRQSLGDDWYDTWVAVQVKRDPIPIQLLFEVVFRCGPTPYLAGVVAFLLRTNEISENLVGQLMYARWGVELQVDALESVLRSMVDTGHRGTALGILSHRIKSNPAEVNHWKPLALQLVTTSELIRSRQMVEYYWKELANHLVADYPGDIAAAILREQADRQSKPWFIEHSDAASVLRCCAEHDPHAVWQAMLPHLSSAETAYRIGIGFSRGVLEKIPVDDLLGWIGEDPAERAAMAARLVTKDISTDETLASRIIGTYGDNERVGNAFRGEFISGSWTGPSSVHWDSLAGTFENVARQTTLPKLRRWALKSAHSLRKMAESDRQREEEEALRWQR